MTYLTRAALVAALTDLREQDFTSTLLGGTVRIRELSARQLADSRQTARREDGSFDTPLWYAMVIAQSVIDASGSPILTPADVARLAEGREGALQALAGAIATLSEARPGDLKSGGAPADGAGDGAAGDGASAA